MDRGALRLHGYSTAILHVIQERYLTQFRNGCILCGNSSPSLSPVW